MNASLELAVLVGIAFGAALEQAGLGNSCKLVGQFYGTDCTVFKVMFSAILTTMLGTFWLDRLGWMDLSALYIPETWLAPQLAGGLLFGVGFVVSGLCPGTACVAAATGRGDGAASMFGLVLGVSLCGLLFAPLADFYASTPQGVLTLPMLLGVPHGVMVFGIVAIALAAFGIIEQMEKTA